MKRLIQMAVMLLAVSCNMHASMKEKTEAEVLKMRADSCYEQGNFPLAMTLYVKGMEVADGGNDYNTKLACIGNIANIFESIGDYESNLFYLLKGYRMLRGKGDVDMTNRYLANIVSAYCRLGDTNKARHYYCLVGRSGSGKNPTEHTYFMMYNLARIMQAEGRLADAEKEHARTLEYAESTGLDDIFRLYQLVEIARLRLQMGRYAEAADIGRRCSAMSGDIRSVEMMVVSCDIMQKAFEALGNRDSFNEYRYRYLELSDSIFHAKGINKAKVRLQEYESRLSDERIGSLSSQVGLQAVAIVLLSAFFLVSVAFAVLLVSKNIKLRKMQRLLISRNNDLIKHDEIRNRLMSACEEGGEAQDKCDSEKANDNCCGMTQMQIDILLARITKLTSDPKIIFDPDLSLKTIADMTGSNTKYVSFVINKTYNQNFRTFINEKRIMKACKMLSDSEKYGNMTMQAIYEEVGFTNAVSFINAFKKVNGITPSMYKKLASEKE